MENMMMNYEDGISYHFANFKFRKSIKEKGLKGGISATLGVFLASIFMDVHKTRNIPKWFYRTTAVYSYPDFSYVYNGDSRYGGYENSDIYALDISESNWFIGSFGISGFCLGSIDIEEINPKCIFNEKEMLKWTRKYWHNFYSKNEFLSKSEKVLTTENDWGLDEILIPVKVPSNKIILIGTFRNGIFYPKPIIKKFIKKEYKNKEKEIYSWMKQCQ